MLYICSPPPLYTYIHSSHTLYCRQVFLSEMSSLSVCVRVCRDKCDSVIYVVLDGGCSCCCTGAEKRTRQKGWTIFLFVGAVEEEDCTDDEKNGSLLLLSQPSRRHLLQTGRRRRFLFLMMGLKPAEIDVVFAYHSPDEVLSFEQQLGQFYLNIDATGIPIFFHRSGLLTMSWMGHKDDRIPSTTCSNYNDE